MIPTLEQVSAPFNQKALVLPYNTFKLQTEIGWDKASFWARQRMHSEVLLISSPVFLL